MRQNATQYIILTCVRFKGVYDCSVHMSEEASNAATAVPIAIISSQGVALVLGLGEASYTSFSSAIADAVLGINIALAFNMGTDIGSIMTSPIGQPLATVSSFRV